MHRGLGNTIACDRRRGSNATQRGSYKTYKVSASEYRDPPQQLVNRLHPPLVGGAPDNPEVPVIGDVCCEDTFF